MTWQQFFSGLIAQCAYASLALFVIGCAWEWMMPGSVLPFIHLGWVGVGVTALLLCSRTSIYDTSS